MYVHITSTAKNIAERNKGDNLPKALKKLSDRLERVSVRDIHPSVMKRIGFPFYRRREGKFRIMGKLMFVNSNSQRIPIMVIWQIFSRGSTEYNRFIDADKSEKEEIAAKYLPDETDLRKEIKPDTPLPPSPPFLPNELSPWLLPFEKSPKETMIFETREWVRRFEEDKHRELAHRYYDLLKKIIDGDEKEVNLGYIEKPFLRFAQDEHATIYYAHFLVDISEHPSEEIMLLLDASDTRNPKLEETLRDGLNGKGNFSWFGKIESESITSNEQMNTVSRQSGRAYYAYILADEYLWRLVEGLSESNKKWEQSEGFDIANPALSVEEMRILNQTKYETNKVVLPLFVNGRAGSGKSTMLYHLFAEYLFRKLRPNPPGKLLFLTYTERLLKESQKTVERLLKAGRNFVGESVDTSELENMLKDVFWVFSDFLMNLIPQEERLRNFPPEKFIAGFGDFRGIYNDVTPKSSKRYAPDITWHIIRTYIKGYNLESYLTPEEYSELPRKERSVSLDIYRWVWDKVWLKYKENYWDTQDLVRYLIEKDAVKPEYAVVFCDEAQDFTRIEQHFLWRLLIYRKYDLKKQGRNLRIPLVFAGDPFQTINPTGFRWKALEAGFYTEITEALDPEGLGLVGFRHEDLSFNYRSTAPIVRFGNLLQMWRELYFKASEKASGKILQTPWREDEHIFPPRLYVIDQTIPESELNEYLKGEVVILPCEYYQENEFVKNDEILSKFGNSKEKPTFLSPMAAKGLEFQRVWLYKFGEHCPESFIKILLSRDVPDDEKLKSEYFLNKLYVAATRAREDLIIIDTEEGEQRLWRKTNKPVLENYIGKVEGVTYGNHYGLEFGHIDPLEIARQLSQTDDPKLLRQASDFYRRAGRKTEAITCEARALEIEKRFDEAGQKYLSLTDIRFFPDAERCFWKGEIWERLNHLYSKWKDGGDSFYRISTQLILAKELSMENLQKFFEYFQRKLEKQSDIIDQRATQTVFKKAIESLVNYAQDEKYKQLLHFVGSLMSQNPALTFILGREKSGWVFYHAGMLKEAVEQWDNTERKPSEYYSSKAKLTHNLSEKIHWFFQGRLFAEIVNLAMEIKNTPQTIRKLSEEDHRLITNSFIKLGEYADALMWYQQNELYKEAFETLKKYWYKLEDRERYLEQFLSSLLNVIRYDPSADKYLDLADDTAKFIQRYLPVDIGMKLIKNYWNTLLQIKEWRKVRESYEKLRGEYAEFGQVAILEEIAQNATPDDKTIPRKDIENFVFDTFSPEEIQNWIKFTPLELVAAVIERVATPPDSLRWYEDVEDQEILSDEQLKFVRLRWLKVKERRLQYLLENKEEEKHKHEYEDFEEKLNLWKIPIHEVRRQPEYPPIVTRSVPIQAEWDGTHCRLTFKDQSVTIDVTDNNVVEFKVNVDKEKQSDCIVFRVEDWDVKGEILSSKKLVLYYKGKPWKEYEVNSK